MIDIQRICKKSGTKIKKENIEKDKNKREEKKERLAGSRKRKKKAKQSKCVGAPSKRYWPNKRTSSPKAACGSVGMDRHFAARTMYSPRVSRLYLYSYLKGVGVCSWKLSVHNRGPLNPCQKTERRLII